MTQSASDAQLIKLDLHDYMPVANKYVYIIDDNDAYTRQLCAQLEQFNYNIEVTDDISRLDRIEHLPISSLPTAFIINNKYLNERCIEKIREIRKRFPLFLPLVILSEDYGFQARLQAVRANGDAFFVKPINVINLVSKLDVLCAVKPPEPFRVLIIEDMASLSNYYSAILQQAGMSTYVINDPTQVQQPLTEFRPDIILLDIYMPECSGYELASIIRQQDNFASIPIVFLSLEKDKGKQLDAMSLGGDDFLTKPIIPEHLIKLVSYRVQRARFLRSLIMKDSLTGLLNHTAIQEQLKIEIAKAERRNSPISFAMLDLDHFKNINDTYGHIVGDRVINNLCRLFIKRLRKSDISGRYGGEEFAFIFTGTPIEEATEICEDIRHEFEELEHLAENTKFKATLSCGVSQYPDYTDPVQLILVADEALYKAKQSGRNKVVAAAAPADSKKTDA